MPIDNKLSIQQRKRLADGRCSVATDSAADPVVVEGRAGRVTDLAPIAAAVDAMNRKYGTTYGTDFFDPAANGVFRLAVARAFGRDSADFAGSPTRSSFSLS